MTIEWDFNRRVIIRNLGTSATKYEIEVIFCKYGKINKLWIARNPPGFAFLEYDCRRNAEDAVRALNGKRCCGRRIEVELTTTLKHDSSYSRQYRRRITSKSQHETHHNRKNYTSKRRSVENSIQRLDCSVCYNNMLGNKPTVTKCGHVFCASCIYQTLKYIGRCPICNTDMNERQLKRIYINT